jgi:hypothetical protein
MVQSSLMHIYTYIWEDTLTSTPVPTLHLLVIISDLNDYLALDSFTKLPQFLDAMDSNTGLQPEHVEQFCQVIQDNLQAFAFGSRKPGRTDLVTMSLKTGDAKPISTPPYHASPAGRKTI